MKLSSLTSQDKNKLAAELDGKHVDGITTDGDCYETIPQRGSPDDAIEVFRYDTSYDTIIPLIQKQPEEVMAFFFKYLKSLATTKESGKYAHLEWWTSLFHFTPSQLLDALLVATGKAEI